MENPEWKKFSCQKCVKELPYLKKLITPAAEDIIKLLCKHKRSYNDTQTQKMKKKIIQTIKDNCTKDNFRILVLMFLVFVATYQYTAVDICENIEGYYLQPKDKLNLFYKCVKEPKDPQLELMDSLIHYNISSAQK